MLIGTGGIAEPGIVGDVDDQVGAFDPLAHEDRKDDLVADEGRRTHTRRRGERVTRGAGGEVFRNGHQPLDTDALQEVVERHVLATGHQMELVHRIDDGAGRIDQHDGIVVAASLRGAGTFLLAHHAGHQRLSLVEELGDGGQPVRAVGEQERHRRFGPQDQRRLRPVRSRGLRRQFEQCPEDVVAPRPIDLGGLLDRRLDDAQRQRWRALGSDGSQPPDAVAGMGRDQQSRQREAGDAMLARREQRWHRKDEHNQCVHPNRANDPDRLHEQRDRHCRIANRVPREAGEQKRAQPLSDGECAGQHHQPAEPVGPRKTGESGGEAVEKGQHRGQQDDGERYGPGVVLRVE